jgi:RNA polymerase sigma-70 factor, ECF subfamily
MSTNANPVKSQITVRRVRAISAPRHLRSVPNPATSALSTNAERSKAPSQIQSTEFVKLCMKYERELFAAAMKMCRNQDDARDLVQETMMRAMLAYESFEPNTNLRAWLYRVITNAFINGYRKRRRHQRLQQARPMDTMSALYGDCNDSAPHAIEQACEESLGDEVSAALATLGSDYRDVVESADLRGEKYRDIADRLGVPIGTVMSRLFRARRALQEQLSDYAERDFGLKAA